MKRLLLFLLVLIGISARAQNENYTALAGPYGGTPSKIISDSGGNLLAIGNGNGVFRSTNGGSSWTASSSGLTDTYITDIYRDDVANKIYAISGTRFYTSVDGGVSWIVGASSGFVGGLRIARGTVTGYLFIVGGSSGNTIYRSTNGGTTWAARITYSSNYINVSDFDISSSGIMYVSTYYSGIFKAGENDLSATQITTAQGLPVYSGTDSYVNSLVTSGSTLYALTHMGPYKSTDSGASWASVVNSGMLCCFYNGKMDSFTDSTPTTYIYVFNDDKVWKTTDGSTWTSVTSPSYVGGRFISSYFYSASTFLAGVDGVSLFKTTNGNVASPTWSLATTGYTAISARQGIFTDNGRFLVAGSSKGLHLTVDDGVSWDFLNSGATATYVAGFYKSGSTIYGYGNGLIKTVDNGSTWSTVFTNTGVPNNFSNTYALASNNGTTMYSYDNYNYTTSTYEYGLEKSTNSGVNWSRQPITGLPGSNNSSLSSAFFLDATASNLFVVLSDYATGTQSIYKINLSTVVATKLTLPTTSHISSCQYYNGKLYVMTDDSKLNISPDGGTTWTSKVIPISYSYLKVLSDNTFYILSDQVYISTDGGNNWVNTGTLDGKIATDVIISSTNYAYIVTQYGTAYKSAAPVIPPAAPSGLVVNGFSNSRIGLTWNDNSNNETYFTIERSTGDNTHYDSIGTIITNSYAKTQAINTLLTANTKYYYRVRAVGSSGKSAYSNEVSTTTLVNTTASSTIPANRSWTGTTNNESGVGIKTNNLVSITSAGSPGFFIIDDLTLGSVSAPGYPQPSSANIVENNGVVFMYSSSTDVSNGNGTWNSATGKLTIHWQTKPRYSSQQETTVFTLNASDPVPAPPTSPFSYINTSTSITVGWTASLFTTQYLVQRSTTTGSGFGTIATLPYTTTTYTDTGLTTGTKYFYRIVALNATGQSAGSVETSITLQNPFFQPIQLTSSFSGKIYGSAWADLDADGLEDILITNTILDQPIQIFRNKGDKTFEPFSGIQNLSTDLLLKGNITPGDYDNDGDVDFLTTGNKDFRLWTNKGAGIFEPTLILAGKGGVYSATFVDYNNDGLLDVSCIQQGTLQPLALFTQAADHTFSRYELGELGSVGIDGLSHSWADYDNDGDMDVYLEAYDYGQDLPNILYKNNGDGTFTKQSIPAFVTDVEIFSESSSWGDIDNDGDLDLFQGNDSQPITMGDMLYQNNGDGTFTRLPASLPAEIVAANFTNGSAFGDVDNDGDLDLYVIRGPNSTLYLNSGTGTFTKYANVEFLNGTTPYDNSAIFGDYDKDGALDLFLQRQDTPLTILHNTNTSGKWIEFKLIGTVSNRSAIGARVTVNLPSNKKQIREVSPISGFNTTNSYVVHFGLGSTATIPSVTVRWPSGTVNTYTNITANQILTITEDAVPPTVVSKNPVAASTGIAATTKLELTFSEAPAAVAGKKVKLLAGATVAQEFNATEGVISGNKVSFTPAGVLLEYTVYSISVEAGTFTDLAGNGMAAIAATDWTFTTADLTPPTITAPTPPAALDKGFGTSSYKLTVSDNAEVSSVTMSYRKVAGGNFDVLTGTLGGGTWNFNVLESFFDATGLEFYFTAKDASGNASRYPATAGSDLFTYLNYKSAVNILPADKIGFGGNKENWKIFSIPFELGTNNAVSTVFDEFSAVINSKADMRMLTYKDATAWGEFPGDFSTITRGKSYFINIRNTISGNVTLPDASAPANTRANLFQMTLKPGWNQIGNPYLTTINWSDVATYNTLTGKLAELWKFNGGGYDKNTTTRSTSDIPQFEGGFVFSDKTTDVAVAIPFVNQTAPGGRIAQISSDLSQQDWQVPFKLAHDGQTTGYSGVGMNESASMGMDEFDGINPPRFFDYTEVNFPHPEHAVKNFAQDVVPTAKEYTWTFIMTSNIDGPAELSWDNTLFGDNSKELFLFDITTQKTIDMRSESRYAFDPAISNKFRVYYGEDLHDKIMPDFVSLGQPYPNPVAEKTTVPFTLPGHDVNYSVRMEVYDILGKKVTTLVDGNYKSGFYHGVWNTEDLSLANGVYTIRFVVGGKNSAVLNKKVILKK